MTEPDDTLDTIPALVTVATLLLLEVQTPLVEGVTLAVLPKHTDVAPPGTGAPGMALIIIEVELSEVQLLLLVTVNEYVVLGASPDIR